MPPTPPLPLWPAAAERARPSLDPEALIEEARRWQRRRRMRRAGLALAALAAVGLAVGIARARELVSFARQQGYRLDELIQLIEDIA